MYRDRRCVKMYALLLFSLSVCSVNSANILFVAPLPSPSHHIWNRALALGLVSKGHNVTHIGPDPEKLKVSNYTHILLEGMYEKLEENFGAEDMAILSPTALLLAMQFYTVFFCETYTKSEGLKRLLDYPANFKFDLVLFDITGGGCLYPFIQRFNYPPTVAVTPFLLPSYLASNFGNHLYPAYVPWYGFPYSQEMTFVERVWNFLYTYVDVIVKHPKLQRQVDTINRQMFGEDAASAAEIEPHISLLLANTDPILDYAQPLAPNVIPVGGLHTREAKELPQDLRSVLDNAKNGVIVFSLGTNVRSDKLDKKIQEELLDAFQKIPETVIWKYESDIDNLPKNVIVRKFLPQNDLLGHPNVKLFIGHGGALSTQEAMFHGIPMICVPFFMDQHLNSRNIVEKKLGVSLDFRKITSGYVLQKVKEVLDDPMYSQNMKRVSERFKSRPESPLERGIFWVEYALRHGGATFLNSPARSLPFYVSSGLDVVTVLVLLFVVSVFMVYKIVKTLVRLLTGKKKIKTN